MAASDRSLVLGDGRLAYLCAQAIKMSTPDVTVIGKHESKLARFTNIGFSTIRLDDVVPDKSFDLVVDCSGSDSGLPLAISLVRPRGTIVMKTTIAAQHQLSLAAIVIDEITVVGSRCGPFAEAIGALQNQAIDVSNLITHRYPLESVHDAMQAAVSPNAFKVVFEINPSAKGA